MKTFLLSIAAAFCFAQNTQKKEPTSDKQVLLSGVTRFGVPVDTFTTWAPPVVVDDVVVI